MDGVKILLIIVIEQIVKLDLTVRRKDLGRVEIGKKLLNKSTKSLFCSTAFTLTIYL